MIRTLIVDDEPFARKGLLVLLAASLVALSPAYSTELPGAEPIDAALKARLHAARAAKPSAYQPRTRHLDEAGDALFTNRLILEASPYLLQHAHNPVNWFAWGDEAGST